MRKVKMWGIINDEGLLVMIHETKVEAGIQNRTAFSAMGEVVPCTISYAIPKKAKGRKV